MKFKVTMKLERDQGGTIIKTEKKWQQKIYLIYIALALMLISFFIMYHGKIESSAAHVYKEIQKNEIVNYLVKNRINKFIQEWNNEIKKFIL